jgi:NAD(P)H-hydrate epimerase
MVAADSGAAGGTARFTPNAILLGPGWGRSPERIPVLQAALERAAAGTPLILDADAITLLRELPGGGYPRLPGNWVILTPHVGEFATLSGTSKEALLKEPLPHVQEWAEKLNCTILYKSSSCLVVNPAGEAYMIEGGNPVLGTGGSGDVLAGLTAGIAARCHAQCSTAMPGGAVIAATAAALLQEAARRISKKFTDPTEIAAIAATLAGEAWL